MGASRTSGQCGERSGGGGGGGVGKGWSVRHQCRGRNPSWRPSVAIDTPSSGARQR